MERIKIKSIKINELSIHFKKKKNQNIYKESEFFFKRAELKEIENKLTTEKNL